jgi:predicted metal-dependent phosphoesterase TrpH
VGRADLHLHTTHSDGTYSPAEVVELARRSGLAALAITDHDTLGAIPAARAAAGSALEVIAGVEISTEFRGRELHLLAYFVNPTDPALNAALTHIRRRRHDRFREMLQLLRRSGVEVLETDLGPESAPDALGRRHLAELLVRSRKVGSVREAFARYLHDGSRFVVPKQPLPVNEAIAVAGSAGGVTAWAHPSNQCDRESLLDLRAWGLGGVEVDYPVVRGARQQQLRAWAAELGLAVTAGSDCHGPGKRMIGACTVSREELAELRDRAKGQAT